MNTGKLDQSCCLMNLQPLTLVPERFSERLALLLLLQRIESIQATHCGRRDGRTYYSIAIYLRQFQSRIPTSSRKHSDPSFVTSGEPHFQIERRFSEFRKLRDCIHKHAFDCGFCSFCGDVLQYVYCSESQPRLLTPVFKGPDQVLSMLTTFLNDLLELSVGSKSSNSRVCEGRERIPSRLAAFLRIRTDNTGEPSM